MNNILDDNGQVTFRKIQKSTSMSHILDNNDVRRSKSFKEKLYSKRESFDSLNKTWEGFYTSKHNINIACPHPNSLNATIIKIEDGIATLLTDAYETFEIAVCLLPNHLTVSNIVTLEIELDDEYQRKRDKKLMELEENIASLMNNK